MSNFVHLHCHTEYSLLDGAIRLNDLCAKAKEFGMPAAAMTDHGNMFGAASFFTIARESGIKPVIGSEVYISKGVHTDFKAADARRRYHLVLLAQNYTGYQNLIKIVTEGYLHGFYHKPRISKDVLRRHSEGLIGLSACLQGEVVRAVCDRGLDAGIAVAKEYESIFPGRFYLEVQANGIAKQDRANELLAELSEATSLPLVGTNDCHYLTADDARAHDILLCVQTNACVDDEKRMRMDTEKLYFRSPEEMIKELASFPQATENTVRIAESCNVEIPMGKYIFPVYDVPEGQTLADELRQMAKNGLLERIKNMPYSVDKTQYQKRLNLELDVICDMDFPGYFLIVQDFINWAKEQSIPVGPGRGSAAGSLVAYALGITNLDPLPYNLLFERFLNIERISMPDIDVDFCERRRGEVIRYTAEKFGEDCVAQITTFGTMKARAVVKDVGRALGMTFAETNNIAKLIPDDLKMTIDKALDMEPELTRLMDNDSRIARLIDVSKRLEGMHRHASTHAAGVVISAGPMSDYLPLYRGKKGEIVTQYDMKLVEKIGLIKFDFLGLRTMTVLQDTLDIIASREKEVPNLDTLPLTDEKAYELYSKGDTDGIFQVESDGMRKYLRKLKPSCFEDVIAMLALYRPGPLGSGMVDEFIKRKAGEIPVSYPLPELESILKDTYGVIVYQEQVMQIAQMVAGYTLGGADILRRAMGKKDPQAMAEQRDIFYAGATEKGVSKEKAKEIFDLMEMFAAYGFNKSHSAAYALISYHTAYLKAHYPTEFMAAVITSEVNNTDKLLKYLAACRDMGIEVLAPSVNHSMRHFTVLEDGKIVFGLAGIKNVGDEAIYEIIRAREKEGPFTSFVNLCERVSLRKTTKRVLEYLIKAGGLDCFDVSRAELMDGLDKVVATAQKRARDKETGQGSLFAMAGMDLPSLPGLGLAKEGPELEEWPDEEKLRHEKEALGFFLSSHPLSAYYHEMKRLNLTSLDQAAHFPAGREVRTAVIVTGKKEIITKKGDKMAFLEIEDLLGSGELVVFPRTWAEVGHVLEKDQPLYIQAKGGDRDRDAASTEEEGGPVRAKLIAEDIRLLADSVKSNTLPAAYTLDAKALENGGMEKLKNILAGYPGKTEMHLTVKTEDFSCKLALGPQYAVTPCQDFWKDLEEL